MQETKQDLYGNEYIEGTCQGKIVFRGGEESGTENDAAAWRNGADGFQGHLGKGCFCGVWLHKWHQKARKIDGTWLNITVSFRYNAEKDETRILFEVL